MNYEFLAEIIGLCGVGICISAYAAKETKQGFGDTLAYSWMNIAGAMLVVISLLQDWNLAAFTQEVIWIAIGLIGIYNHKKQSA